MIVAQYHCKACGYTLKISADSLPLNDMICETCFEINTVDDLLENYTPIPFSSHPMQNPKHQRIRELMSELRRKFDDEKLYMNELRIYLKDETV
jgi:hypothetical protein